MWFRAFRGLGFKVQGFRVLGLRAFRGFGVSRFRGFTVVSWGSGVCSRGCKVSGFRVWEFQAIVALMGLG